MTVIGNRPEDLRGAPAAPSEPAAVEFDRVQLRYRRPDGSLTAIEDATFAVPDRSFVSIVGPSGCGKSTLLKIGVGTLSPTAGRVLVRGQPVIPFNRDVGFVAQHFDLFPWLTVSGNLEFPLLVRGYSEGRRHALLAEFVALAGLEGFERHYPRELSGGMQKRASLVRTLAYDPAIIFMDEPFGALDALTKLRLQTELMRLWERRRKAILFVTHDLTEAITLSDTVVVITRRPGRVKAIVDIPIPRPRDAYTIQTHPDFGPTYERIWAAVREDVIDEGKAGSVRQP